MLMDEDELGVSQVVRRHETGEFVKLARDGKPLEPCTFYLGAKTFNKVKQGTCSDGISVYPARLQVSSSEPGLWEYRYAHVDVGQFYGSSSDSTDQKTQAGHER